MKQNLVYIAVCAALLSACHQPQPAAPSSDLLALNMDTTIQPNQDFFHYANGGWLKNNPIPNDETKWGIGNKVKEELYSRLKNINELALNKGAKSGVDQQIGDFWYSGLDTVSIESKGAEPLRTELNAIQSLKTPAEVMTQAAHMHTYNTSVFFNEGAGQDVKQSDIMAYYIGQGGLGLPDRDYYFNTDPITTKVRNAYPLYVAKMLTLSGIDSAQSAEKAKNIIALETKLARASRKLEDLRDPYANYHKMAISDLKKTYPVIDWAAVITKIGVKHVDSVIIGQPEFLKALDGVIASEKIETLRDYLTFHLLKSFATTLSTPFVTANFDFYGKTINGAKQLRPRWKRTLDAEEEAIGEALGQLFAREYFNETAKKRYNDMVENIRVAYKARIEHLDWMTDSTKQKALFKLSTIRKKVGYPDKWKDFSTLKIDRGPYALNVMRAREWWNNYSLNKLGKPVDRDEWDMTPQTYNAYYNPSNNEIVLPAGMFTVPGKRDTELDDALVYGYTAASTIGHEITHGFDDEGRQFDEKGNLKNWWSKTDEVQFKKRSQLLVNQFNGMVVVDTLHINGKASLGENLADLGGILLGIDAFKQTTTYKEGKKISGLTPMQRFFQGYALGWMMQIRQEQMASQLMTDVHAPAQYRVNGPMPNVPDFYEAFNVKPGDKMYLADSLRVHLW
jgi:putative endopeptidase